MKQKLLISFSGGRTSAFMTWWLMENMQHKYEMIIVFANTGKEREETLQFVQQCSNYFRWSITWVECITNPVNGKGVTAKVVAFKTANRCGDVFEKMIAKHGIPNVENGHCSRELKGRTIRAFARSFGWQFSDYSTALGIRSDEPRRLNWKKAKLERLLYPLATLIKTTKADVNLFWRQQPFDLNLKSYEGNCTLCWKKSLRKLKTLVGDNPALADWWREMEIKFGDYVPESRKHNPKIKLPARFYRDNLSIDEIIEESKLPFVPAIDESKGIDEYSQLAFFNAYEDMDGGCAESCEAF